MWRKLASIGSRCGVARVASSRMRVKSRRLGHLVHGYSSERALCDRYSAAAIARAAAAGSPPSRSGRPTTITSAPARTASAGVATRA